MLYKIKENSYLIYDFIEIKEKGNFQGGYLTKGENFCAVGF
jgi:hypothetical protein